jgi:uncharacterized protein (TIRG00374 family)
VKRWQTLGIGLAISVLAFYFALRGVDFGKLQLVITEGHYIWLIPVAICSLLSAGVRALRWKTLLNNRIQFTHSFHILNASYLFNAFLPMRLGEVVRAFMTTRLDPQIPVVTALSTVVVERIMDLLAVVVMAIIALFIAPVSQEIAFAARTSGILALIGIGVLVLCSARPAIPRQILARLTTMLPFLKRYPLERLLDRVLEGVAPLGVFRTAIPIIVWTMLAWSISVTQVYLLLFVFYDSPTLQAALLVSVLSALAIALPAVPGNVGPFEAAVVFALGLSLLAAPDSVGQSRAFGLAVLFHLNSVITFVILGWIGLVQEQMTAAGLFRSVQRQPANPN